MLQCNMTPKFCNFLILSLIFFKNCYLFLQQIFQKMQVYLLTNIRILSSHKNIFVLFFRKTSLCVVAYQITFFFKLSYVLLFSVKDFKIKRHPFKQLFEFFKYIKNARSLILKSGCLFVFHNSS